MHHRFLITIDEVTFSRLSDLAERERRGVKDQATVLLEYGLRLGAASPIGGPMQPNPPIPAGEAA